MTINWIDGVPYNDFAEQLFQWRDCDTGASIEEGGVPLLCPTHPCDEELVETICCPDGLPLVLTLSWPSSTYGPGDSVPLTWDGSVSWTFSGQVASHTPFPEFESEFCDLIVSLSCDSNAFSIIINGSEQFPTTDSCDPLHITISEDILLCNTTVLFEPVVTE